MPQLGSVAVPWLHTLCVQGSRGDSPLSQHLPHNTAVLMVTKKRGGVYQEQFKKMARLMESRSVRSVGKGARIDVRTSLTDALLTTFIKK